MVRIARAKSIFPFADKYPIAPEYNPRFDFSNELIISMARTFGAPETVPAGRQAARASIAVLSVVNVPAYF